MLINFFFSQTLSYKHVSFNICAQRILTIEVLINAEPAVILIARSMVRKKIKIEEIHSSR